MFVFLKRLILTCSVAWAIGARAQGAMYQLKSDFANLRFGVMVHFNMGTFTNEEWAAPNHNPKDFNPQKLDCNQWADACQAAGMRYGILTTKHHDGFCLWDSKYTDYDVASSPYKKDIVKQYVDAFRSRGMKPCLYFSIWDRHNGVENGGPREEQFVLNQLTELLTNYGPIPLIIFDGWNWKVGHRRISYQRVYEHVKKVQPGCLVAEHNGNSNFQTDIIYYEGPKGVFPPGNNVFASQMALTATDGWFWHPGAATQVKSLDYFLDKLQRLEPVYCNFMINIGPNRDGLFDKEVVNRLKEIGQRWKPNPERLPLPKQPESMNSFAWPVAIMASSGSTLIQPAPPATLGSPVGALLNDTTPAVMIDGCSDEVPDRGGFSPFQTCWKFAGGNERFLTLDFGKPVAVSKFYYLPARRMGNYGIITKYILYASNDGKGFKKIKEGAWGMNTGLKISGFDRITTRYIKLEIVGAVGDAIVSEVGAGS